MIDAAELEALRATARTFAEEHLAPHAVQWDADKHFPVDVLRRAGSLGFAGIWLAEDVGGVGLGRAEAVRVFEELARGDTSIASYLSIHTMVASMIDTHGTAAQRERWVPDLAEARTLASYCLTEPDAGSDAASLRTTARPDGDGWVLDGVKQFISGAGTSDVYVVMARTDGPGAGGVSAFVVERETPGLSFGANEIKMGWNAQPTRQVILDGVRVEADQLLGDRGKGFSIAMNGLNGGRLNIGAASLGGGQWALDRAVAHLSQREAFGGPLIANPGLVSTLADAHVGLAAARALLHQAADALDAGAPDASVQCAMAKKAATDAGFEAANTALQMHGGYGYLSEYGVEKVVRDLRVHQILEGTNEIMSLIVGRHLAAGARA